LEGGMVWRAQLRKIFEDIAEDNFICPHGKNWGDTGIQVQPEIQNNIYSDSITYNKLGDSWQFICWLLLQSEETGEIPVVTYNQKFEEIIKLIDSKGKIEFTDQKGSKINNAYWSIKNPPTKIKWVPGRYKRICYQFNANIVTKPPRWDLLEFFEKFKDYELVRLDKHLTLEECVKIASTCDVFVGVSSGMSHMMHSVGIPMFLVTYNFDIKLYHGQNEYVICDNLIDCEAKLRKYLTDGIYEPKTYAVDPYAPKNMMSCGCIPRIWDELKDLSGSVSDIAKFIMEPRADHAEYLKRKNVCMKCIAADSSGFRLFRKLNENYYTCGDLRTQKVLRDSKVDGCGCILNIKWAGSSQKCIRDYW
jgi:hypothetical protein